MKDELVPSSMMTELYEKCGSKDKEVFQMPNGGHNDNWYYDRENYFDRLKQFVSKLWCMYEYFNMSA